MKSSRTLRRWPSRSFLTELSLEHEPTEVQDLVRRERPLRRLTRSFTAKSEVVRLQVRRSDWIALSDARSELQTAEFEAAFDLGFEHGLIAGRAERRVGRASTRAKQFRLQLRSMLARNTLTNHDLLGAMLDLCAALTREPPRGGQRRQPGLLKP